MEKFSFEKIRVGTLMKYYDSCADLDDPRYALVLAVEEGDEGTLLYWVTKNPFGGRRFGRVGFYERANWSVLS
jgi:hypothetical protein